MYRYDGLFAQTPVKLLVNPLRFRPLFCGIGEVSDRLQSIGRAMAAFTDLIGKGWERLHQMGEPIPQHNQSVTADVVALFDGATTPPDAGGGSARAADNSVDRIKRSATLSGQIGVMDLASMISGPIIDPGRTSWGVSKFSIDSRLDMINRLCRFATEPSSTSSARESELPAQLGLRYLPTMTIPLTPTPIDSLPQSANASGILGHHFKEADMKPIGAAEAWRWSLLDSHDEPAIAPVLAPFRGGDALNLPRELRGESGRLSAVHSFNDERADQSFVSRATKSTRSLRLRTGERWIAGLAPHATTWFDRLVSMPLRIIDADVRHSGSLNHPSANLPDLTKRANGARIKLPGAGTLACVEWPDKAAGLVRSPRHCVVQSSSEYTSLAKMLIAPWSAIGLATRTTAEIAASATAPTDPVISLSVPIRPGATSITVNYAPVINGAGLDEHQLLRVLERHAHELHRIISRQQERRERLAFN
jgi:hypothetical protein